MRTRAFRFRTCLIVLAAGAVFGLPSDSVAQERRLSIETIERYFAAGLSSTAVLNEIRGFCVDFRADDPQARQRLTAAGADEAFLRALTGLCYQGPPGTTDAAIPAAAGPAAGPAADSLTPPQRIQAPDPGAAAVRSLLIPGLGQFYSGRPVVGVLFLGAATSTLAAGALSESTTVFCARQTTGPCAPEDVIREESESRLLLGVAAYGVVALASALEALSGVRRSQRALHSPIIEPRFGIDGEGRSLLALQVRF